MSQRATNKTPCRRTPSIDPSEKIIIRHCLLRDVPEGGELIGFSSTSDPDSIVFVCGSKQDELDKQLIYASFKEATNCSSFQKYLNKFLIPCYSRPWGKNGITNIYNGKRDYTVLEEDDAQEEDKENDPKVIQDVQIIEEIVVETPQKVQRRKRTHEDIVQAVPSVSKENTPEVNVQNDEEVESSSPKRQRLLEPIDETPERSMFARSEPAFISLLSPSLTLNIPNNNERQQQSSNDFSPNSTHSSTPPPLDVAELEQQQFEQIQNTRSWFNYNNSEEKFIEDHMPDARNPAFALGAAGIDPYEVPQDLIKHMKPSFFSTPQILSRSFEVDDEPEEDSDDEMENYVEVSRPQQRSSFCSLM